MCAEACRHSSTGTHCKPHARRNKPTHILRTEKGHQIKVCPHMPAHLLREKRCCKKKCADTCRHMPAHAGTRRHTLNEKRRPTKKCADTCRHTSNEKRRPTKKCADTCRHTSNEKRRPTKKCADTCRHTSNEKRSVCRGMPTQFNPERHVRGTWGTSPWHCKRPGVPASALAPSRRQRQKL